MSRVPLMKLPRLPQVVSLPRGHAACHASGLRHAGNPITAGTRWVRLRGYRALRALSALGGVPPSP